MERLRKLNLYQKALLVFLAGMIVVYTVAYIITTSREGFLYRNTILVPSQSEEGTLYSGKIDGEKAVFTVSEDRTVSFTYADETYGPYICKEDPSAIPSDNVIADSMTGLQISLDGQVVFRGGVLKMTDGSYWLFDEEGNVVDSGVTVVSVDGTKRDEEGNIIREAYEPALSEIVTLMLGPQIIHRGSWFAWIIGVLSCVMTGVSIILSEEIFRWNLSFWIKDPEKSEPTELELLRRNASWALVSFITLYLFINGLRM